MSDSSGELKLEPDMLGSHGHLFDTLPTAVRVMNIIVSKIMKRREAVTLVSLETMIEL